MKTILLTLATALLISCSNDDSTESKDCSKGTIIEAQRMSTGGGTMYTAITVKNDCTGELSYYQKVGAYFVGDKY